MLNTIEIQETADGSNTLYIKEIEEHYHSVNGAVAEALHVYILTALNIAISEFDKINVFEVGFGTALNTFLSLLEAESTKTDIIYHSIELNPINKEMAACLNYADVIYELYSKTEEYRSLCAKYSRDDFRRLYMMLHNVEWDKEVKISDYFSLKKIHCDLNKYEFSDTYNVIYFDAFGPDKQSDLWNQELFDKIYAHTSNNGVLSTYCAKGVVRRMFASAGYKMERLPGPVGKREILRARKL